MQIIKNLKPYWKSVLIIVLLLIVQAYCDLALPDYTSKLIDTGIQNYGIDHCSPLQIPEKAYTIIKGFMDEDDVTVWEKYYEQSDDGIYHMTDDGKDHIDEIDQACMEPMMMYYYPYTMVDSDEDNQLKQMLAASGMTLDELPPEMWSQMGTQMKQMIENFKRNIIFSKKYWLLLKSFLRLFMRVIQPPLCGMQIRFSQLFVWEMSCMA